MRPTRPMASCTVAEPKGASLSTAARSARLMLRLTIPSSVMVLSFTGRSPSTRRRAWIDAARVALVDLVAVLGAQVLRRFDVALRIVEVMPGLRVDRAHR